MDELKNLDNLKYYEVTEDNPLFIKLQSFDKKKLYHYTNNSGAKGIVENRCFWVTRSDYLDDKSEIKYICEVLKGVILHLKDNTQLYDLNANGQYEILEIIIRTLEGIKTVYEHDSIISDGHIYLLSLTHNQYNKYLMENYAGNNGAILQFKSDIKGIAKKNKFKNYHIPIFCANVVYDYREQLTLIIKDINEFYTELIETLVLCKEKIDFNEMVETIKSVLYMKIINYSLFFKHKSFSKEQENRIAFIIGDKYSNELVKYRNKGEKTIPYIEVKFSRKSLKVIK